eukprot:GFUD01015576.1.p1 GENE.GFUD01015576.1~~GFUD01015576.1.p1  ORF type:complete len:498 (+),score=105.88 GFUD01015576.1:152-1645(+)
MSISPSAHCITDCSILNQTTCQLVSRRPMTLDQDKIYSQLWSQDGCYNSTLFQATEGYKVYEKFSVLMSVMMIILGLLGLCGNMFSIAVLARKEMRNCFNHILIAINICDSLHLVFAIMDAVRNSFGDFYPVQLLQIFPYIHYPFYRISLCASIYLIISVAIERYLAVCQPHHYREVQSDSCRSLLYILPSLAVALVVNSSRFLETETDKICIDFSKCGPCYDGAVWAYYVKPTKLRMDKQYIIYYHTWTWVVSTGLVPFIILMFLNLRILISLKRLRSRLNVSCSGVNPDKAKMRERRVTQQSRDLNLAIVLISTVIMFFFCHLPRLVTSIYEAANIHSILDCREKGQDKTPLWFMYVTAAVQLLMVVNASLNLPIYFFAGKSFRETSMQLIRCFLPPFIIRVDEDNNIGWRCFNCGTINLSIGAGGAGGGTAGHAGHEGGGSDDRSLEEFGQTSHSQQDQNELSSICVQPRPVITSCEQQEGIPVTGREVLVTSL